MEASPAPLSDLECVSLGTISFTRQDVADYCRLAADGNPIHQGDEGIIPLGLLVGSVGGKLFEWGRQNSVKKAVIIGYTPAIECEPGQLQPGRRPAKVGKLYTVSAYFDDTLALAGRVDVHFEIEDAENPSSFVLKGEFQIKYFR